MRRRLALTAGLSSLPALAFQAGATAPAGAGGAYQVRRFGGARALGAPGGALKRTARRHRGDAAAATATGCSRRTAASSATAAAVLRLDRQHAPQPAGVGIAAHAARQRLLARRADGGIFTFGRARFYGSTGAMHLNSPIVGMASTPTGRGYWLAAADGGIFTFGDARFYGSAAAFYLGAPVVGITTTRPRARLLARDCERSRAALRRRARAARRRVTHPDRRPRAHCDRRGLWLVASNGAVYTSGRARYAGGAPAVRAGRGHRTRRPRLLGRTRAVGSAASPNSGTGRAIVYSERATADLARRGQRRGGRTRTSCRPARLPSVACTTCTRR